MKGGRHMRCKLLEFEVTSQKNPKKPPKTGLSRFLSLGSALEGPEGRGKPRVPFSHSDHLSDGRSSPLGLQLLLGRASELSASAGWPCPLGSSTDTSMLCSCCSGTFCNDWVPGGLLLPCLPSRLSFCVISSLHYSPSVEILTLLYIFLVEPWLKQLAFGG